MDGSWSVGHVVPYYPQQICDPSYRPCPKLVPSVSMITPVCSLPLLPILQHRYDLGDLPKPICVAGRRCGSCATRLMDAHEAVTHKVQQCSDIAAMWFSSFLENELVNRVNRCMSGVSFCARAFPACNPPTRPSVTVADSCPVPRAWPSVQWPAGQSRTRVR